MRACECVRACACVCVCVCVHMRGVICQLSTHLRYNAAFMNVCECSGGGGGGGGGRQVIALANNDELQWGQQRKASVGSAYDDVTVFSSRCHRR